MSDVFKKVIRDFKISQKFTSVFTVAPELELVCTRVCAFIGYNFIGEAKPLVAEMLIDALAAHKDATPEESPQVAFARGLFARAHLLFARRYVAWLGEKYQIWCPMFEPVPAFEARYCDYRLEMADERCPEEVTQRSVALQLAARTLSSEHFRLYFEDYDVAHALPDCEVVPH
ncbi:hypothetical protein [Robbsia andropogonis]|uniref:hypothetical protein n=1 Tax=Robbsia andropogonis TaxID=28092 RepID=UPI002A6B5ED5|nr:hypothetical protein [Robbsia andropogonis]